MIPNVVQANNDERVMINYEIIEENNGYYTEVVTYEIEQVQTRSVSTKKGAKDYNYKNSNGEILWTVTVYGTFEFDGTTSRCTDATVTVSNISSGWNVFSKKANASGNQAVAQVIMRYLPTAILKQVNLTLTCSPTGVFS